MKRDEFERFHPLMQKLLKLDSRSRVSHPEYRSRGFLLEPCDAEKSTNVKEAMKEPNADVQDALLPDSIRSEWTACATEASRQEDTVYPVPCASAHVLSRRCVLQREEMKKHHLELQDVFEKFDGAGHIATLNQQWLDEYCTETRLRMHREALAVQKNLLMLRYADAAVTDRESEIHSFVKGIRSILHGSPIAEVLGKYCCGPSFFELVCGKTPLSEGIATLADRTRRADLRDGHHETSLSAASDDQSTMEILDGLENVRAGTNMMIESVHDDMKMLENVEKNAKS